MWTLGAAWLPWRCPYQLDSFNSGQKQGGTGVRIDSGWVYRQVEDSRDAGELPAVEVCVVRRGAPWTCLPRKRAVIIKQVDGVEVAVYDIGPGKLPPDSGWHDVEFTTDWREVAWLK